MCDDTYNEVLIGQGNAGNLCNLTDVSSVVVSATPKKGITFDFNHNSTGAKNAGILVSGITDGDIFRICFDKSKVSGLLKGGIVQWGADNSYACALDEATYFDLCPNDRGWDDRQMNIWIWWLTMI